MDYYLAPFSGDNYISGKSVSSSHASVLNCVFKVLSTKYKQLRKPTIETHALHLYEPLSIEMQFGNGNLGGGGGGGEIVLRERSFTLPL